MKEAYKEVFEHRKALCDTCPKSFCMIKKKVKFFSSKCPVGDWDEKWESEYTRKRDIANEKQRQKRKKQSKEYFLNCIILNKDKLDANIQEYKIQNKEKIQAYQRKYQKNYRNKHKEERKEYFKKYYMSVIKPKRKELQNVKHETTA